MINPKREVRELSLNFRGKPLEEMLKSLKQIIEKPDPSGKPTIMMVSSKSAFDLELLDTMEAAQGGTMTTGGHDIDPAVM